MSKEYIQLKAKDIYKLLHETYNVPTVMCNLIGRYLQLLESIVNTEPNEALTEIFNIIYNLDCGTTFEQDMKLNECRKNINRALYRLKSIDNSNPSEALECLGRIEADLIGLPKHVTEYDDIFDDYLDDIENNIDTIEQALLKSQEPKQYLKWEDLKKSNSEEHLKVKLNNVKYELHFEKWANYDDATRISLYLNEFCVMSIRLKTNYDKQFFNDLHLERVEE